MSLIFLRCTCRAASSPAGPEGADPTWVVIPGGQGSAPSPHKVSTPLPPPPPNTDHNRALFPEKMRAPPPPLLIVSIISRAQHDISFKPSWIQPFSQQISCAVRHGLIIYKDTLPFACVLFKDNRQNSFAAKISCLFPHTCLLVYNIHNWSVPLCYISAARWVGASSEMLYSRGWETKYILYCIFFIYIFAHLWLLFIFI